MKNIDKDMNEAIYGKVCSIDVYGYFYENVRRFDSVEIANDFMTAYPEWGILKQEGKYTYLCHNTNHGILKGFS